MTNPAKEALRREALAWREGLSHEEKAAGEGEMLRRLGALPAWAGADLILTYYSTPREIDTHGLIAAALGEGRTVALPRCDYQTRRLVFLECRGEDALMPAPMALWEPDPRRCPPVTPGAGTLCVVPALAADGAGLRMGYGGGWYDRFLEDFPGTALALCWDCWRLQKIPADPWDRPVKLVVTQTGCWPSRALP